MTDWQTVGRLLRASTRPSPLPVPLRRAVHGFSLTCAYSIPPFLPSSHPSAPPIQQPFRAHDSTRAARSIPTIMMVRSTPAATFLVYRTLRNVLSISLESPLSRNPLDLPSLSLNLPRSPVSLRSLPLALSLSSHSLFLSDSTRVSLSLSLSLSYATCTACAISLSIVSR